MTSGQLLGAAIGAAVAILLFWVAASALVRWRLRAGIVRSPEGQPWAVRLHWSHPKARIGASKKIFGTSHQELAPNSRTTTEGRVTKGDVAGELFSGLGGDFDGWLMGIAAGLFLIFAAFFVVVLALELAIIALAAIVLGWARIVLGHGWFIEIVDPSGTQYLARVKGRQSAIEEIETVKTEIQAGDFDPANHPLLTP